MEFSVVMIKRNTENAMLIEGEFYVTWEGSNDRRFQNFERCEEIL